MLPSLHPYYSILFSRLYEAAATEPTLLLTFFLFPPKSLPFPRSCLQLLCGFVSIFAPPPTFHVLFFAYHPWTLVLRMMQRSRWGVWSIPVGLAALVTTSTTYCRYAHRCYTVLVWRRFSLTVVVNTILQRLGRAWIRRFRPRGGHQNSPFRG